MEKIRALFLGLLLLLVVHCYVAAADELKVNETNVSTGVDPQLKDKTNIKEKASESGSDHIDTQKKKEGDQLDKLKSGVDNGKSMNGSDSQTASKEDGNVKKGKGDTSKEGLVKDGGGDREKNSAGESKSKEVPIQKGNEGTAKDSSNQKKEGPSVEECTPSNMCVDHDDKMVACLRVPGDESPEFSILIQNKGEDAVDVTISAPSHVQVEIRNIQLPGKNNTKVKVSITDVGSKSLIILRGVNGYCNLDIKDLIAHQFGKEFQNSHKSTSLNFLSQSSTWVILLIAALLILASLWMCISFRKKQLLSTAAKYQMLEMELPVTGGAKRVSEINDGWDESWGDDWDDEEAQKTPSMPVTPSLSSKGLASRRLNKDGWKD